MCCDDHVHCCPLGQTCDTKKGVCIKGDLQTPLGVKTPAKVTVRNVEATWVICPDKLSMCPDGDTCCKMSSGLYGCCPLPKVRKLQPVLAELFCSLWPCDAIWRQKSGSTLALVMAWCLKAPSHYLNQCRLIISKVMWPSSEGSFIRNTSAISS